MIPFKGRAVDQGKEPEVENLVTMSLKRDTTQGCGSGPFWLDPENFHRILIRILSVLWQCIVVKNRKKHFKKSFYTFSGEIFHFFR